MDKQNNEMEAIKKLAMTAFIRLGYSHYDYKTSTGLRDDNETEYQQEAQKNLDDIHNMKFFLNNETMKKAEEEAYSE